MKHLLNACACLSALSICFVASASQWLRHPGSECTFDAHSPSADNVFSRSGGNGMLHNVSGATADAVCPIPRDRLRSPQGRVSNWFLYTIGTSGWDATKCNIFAQKWGTGWAFPSSANSLAPDSSSIGGSVAGSGKYMGDSQLEIICRIPAGGGIKGTDVFVQ